MLRHRAAAAACGWQRHTVRRRAQPRLGQQMVFAQPFTKFNGVLQKIYGFLQLWTTTWTIIRSYSVGGGFD